MDQETNRRNYAKLLAKAWSDPAYKARLLANPATAVAELGVQLLPGKTLHVVENTDTDIYMVLPKPPPGAALSDDALDQAVGGFCLCFDHC